MKRRVLSLPTHEAIRAHVLAILCELDRLDPKQTPLLQSTLQRAGKPCGIFFQLNGPRMLKTYAVWSTEESRVVFYDSTGARFAETTITDGPDTLHAAA